MTTDKINEIVLEILRVGLISIRNLAERPNRGNKYELMLQFWAELCHSLPPILLGACDLRSIKYFLNGDGARFQFHYPSKDDDDYLQIIGLINELFIIINDSERKTNVLPQ